MVRKIIKIDKNKCSGCGLCAEACLEGAIGIVDGKAKLLRDDYCDGLGNCLPVCPTGAITFEERDTAAFDEAAVRTGEKAHANEQANLESKQGEPLACGCPGSQSKSIERGSLPEGSPGGGSEGYRGGAREKACNTAMTAPAETHLRQWPVQIKLVPANAPYFNNADLLVAADCAAYAYGNFHNDYIKNRITVIGCPKLDMVDYSEKLTAILKTNKIKSVTVVRMEVPCCGGIENAVVTALKDCGKMIPWQVITISNDGRILEN